ncbi:anthranilate synthase component 1 [Litorilituus sediminis]|uniref:Anthranilate synthase component 1 n=1 Tax=Litorilituus sediminis TaxID=718192 RepID=A0A4P6PD29_9GAMM|nr:anthranilate synthase component 1 [Litorilituus sediminis]QBG37607.1 anthranilate synthase component 1 [Litorilituus sediminis]
MNLNVHNGHNTAVLTQSITAPYHNDPLAVYQLLCQHKENTLLLESAEIDKKHLLKSLLLTDAAVKIVCRGQQVSFTALSKSGEQALAFVQTQLADKAKLAFSETDKALTAVFPAVEQELDEMSRLMASNPFESLRLFKRIENHNQHPFAIFLGGAFAFDMMSMAEALPDVQEGENTCPDFVYYLAENLVVIDHEQQSTEIINNHFTLDKNATIDTQQNARIEEIKQILASPVTPMPAIKAQQPAQSEVTSDLSDDAFCSIVNKLKENIRAGDIFQVVPSRTFTLPCQDSISAYQALKLSNPSPYMFYLQDSDFCIFGASPESAIKYQQHNRQVEIYPIAGTRPRGFDQHGNISLDLDSRIELELRQDKKESAEHIMLVDLARNDIARVSQAGTRFVADLLKVDRYSHVMHLVSRVCGTLLPELDALHAYQACMNMGTLSGAPKVKATSLIREVEGKRRGSYGGAVGYLTGNGDMDTCIVIRSAFVKDNIAQVQAGAGVVYDSDPQSEANETRQKAQAVISAISRANNVIRTKEH